MKQTKLNPIHKSYILVFTLFCMVMSSCSSLPAITAPVFKSKELQYEFRCPGDDISFSWSISDPGGNFRRVNLELGINDSISLDIIDNNNSDFQNPEGSVRFNPESLVEVENREYGSNWTIPERLTLNLSISFRRRALSPYETDPVGATSLEKIEVLTIKADDDYTKDAIPDPSQEMRWKLEIPEDTYSPNLSITRLGVNQPVEFSDVEWASAQFQYDKGPGINGLISGPNWFTILTQPVQAQGVWIIDAFPETLVKNIERLPTKFRLACPR